MKLVAHEAALPGGKVFVAIPNERGRYLLAHLCVARVPCPVCKAVVGEPCKNILAGKARYGVESHWRRRDAYKRGEFVAKKKASKALVPPDLASDDPFAETSGQPWVLGRHPPDDLPWSWYTGHNWQSVHDSVLLFPSSIAAKSQKEAFGALTPKWVLRAMSLGEAQAIWNELCAQREKAAKGPK